jgi:hypothetical protein
MISGAGFNHRYIDSTKTDFIQSFFQQILCKIGFRNKQQPIITNIMFRVQDDQVQTNSMLINEWVDVQDDLYIKLIIQHGHGDNQDCCF